MSEPSGGAQSAPVAAPELLPAGLRPLLGRYIAAQRWYAGTTEPTDLLVIDARQLLAGRDGARLYWAIVAIDGVRYQLLVGEAASPPGGAAVIGPASGGVFYDATFDAELMLGLYRQVAGVTAERVRPVGAEQSNTSLVYDDAVIMKLYRRLLDGDNPDIAVTSALADVGFDHVAEPVASWRADGVDLAFAQRFLSGGSEGWALALASVRELCAHQGGRASGSADSVGSGGGEIRPDLVASDFAREARALGQMTAELHVALAEAFGVEPDGLQAGWAAFVDDLETRLRQELGGGAGGEPGGLSDLVARLRAVPHAGPALRVHGDYHLGQVMRSGGRWYVLDFEGEPARGLEERVRPSSAAKDVSGMLRSLDYASRFALRDPGHGDTARDEACAHAWERHNRAAYLDGYLAAPGITALLAGPEAAEAVLAAFELDKALYELRYEQAYRPDWVDIPRAAIGRIVERLA
jgi:maltokinase